MLISNLSSKPQFPRVPGRQPEEKSPHQMDQFELQQEVWDAERQVAQLRQAAASGHTRGLVGMGVLFTSLGTMVAQTLLSGGHGLSGALIAPLAVGAATGVGLFATGIWKRDSAEIEISSARFEAEHLRGLYQDRFGKPE